MGKLGESVGRACALSSLTYKTVQRMFAEEEYEIARLRAHRENRLNRDGPRFDPQRPNLTIRRFLEHGPWATKRSRRIGPPAFAFIVSYFLKLNDPRSIVEDVAKPKKRKRAERQSERGRQKERGSKHLTKDVSINEASVDR